MGTIITQKIGDFIYSKILKKNKINTNNSYVNIVTQFISNYNNVKSEDEFLYFIIYTFGICINNFLNIKHMKEKTFNALKNLAIIQKNSYDFIQFYNKYINKLIEPIIKSFAVDFLDYQVEIQKQKNKEIKLQNKKTIKEFSEIITNFLNDNFNYLAQVYYIFNIIPSYCPNLSKSFEKHLNELTKKLLNNSRVKERINECFINKFRNFQRRVNKFFYSDDKKYTTIDLPRDNTNYDNELDYLSLNEKESRNKINMTIVKNNLSLSKRNLMKSDLNNDTNTYKEENSNSNNSLQNSLPSYTDFLKGNFNNNNNSAPTAKFNK